MREILNITIIAGVLLLLDAYILNGLGGVSAKWRFIQKKQFTLIYWAFCAVLAGILLLGMYVNLGVGIRATFMLVFSLIFIGKISFLAFLIIDDLRRFVIRIQRFKNSKKAKATTPPNQPAFYPSI